MCLLFGFVISCQKKISAKAVHEMLVKLTTGVNFINVLHTFFAHVDSKLAKNTVKSALSFYAFGLCKHKSCMKNVDEIEPRY